MTRIDLAGSHVDGFQDLAIGIPGANLSAGVARGLVELRLGSAASPLTAAAQRWFLDATDVVCASAAAGRYGEGRSRGSWGSAQAQAGEVGGWLKVRPKEQGSKKNARWRTKDLDHLEVELNPQTFTGGGRGAVRFYLLSRADRARGTL